MSERLESLLDDLINAQMDELFEPLADGVEGMLRDLGSHIELGVIRATAPGTGAVGQFLDQLPRDRKVIVPYVTSERLQEMLARRGFVERQRFDPKVGGWGLVWVRIPPRVVNRTQEDADE